MQWQVVAGRQVVCRTHHKTRWWQCRNGGSEKRQAEAGSMPSRTRRLNQYGRIKPRQAEKGRSSRCRQRQEWQAGRQVGRNAESRQAQVGRQCRKTRQVGGSGRQVQVGGRTRPNQTIQQKGRGIGSGSGGEQVVNPTSSESKARKETA